MTEKKGLVGTKTVLLFGGIVAVVFVILFHNQKDMNALFKLVHPDRFSVLYLRLLVSMNPDEPDRRLALARDYNELGEFDDAYGVLGPLLTKKDLKSTEAKLLSLEIDLNSYFASDYTKLIREAELMEIKKKWRLSPKNTFPLS